MAKNKITDKSYTLIESADLAGSPVATYSVKIKDKKYKDVVVSYGKISLTVQDNKETAKLSFKYQIDDSAEFDRQKLESDQNFNNYIGDILSHIIQSAFDSGNYTVGENTPTKASDEVIDVNSTTDDSSPEISQR